MNSESLNFPVISNSNTGGGGMFPTPGFSSQYDDVPKPNVYSATDSIFRNFDSGFNTQLKINYWKRYMKILVLPGIPNSMTFDYKNNIALLLMPKDCYILLHMLLAFKNRNPEDTHNYVMEVSNKGQLGIDDGSSFNSTTPVLFLRKYNSDNIETSQVMIYKFNTSGNFYCKNYKSPTDYIRVDLDWEFEFDILINVVKQWCDQLGNAIPARVLDEIEYNGIGKDIKALRKAMNLPEFEQSTYSKRPAIGPLAAANRNRATYGSVSDAL